MDSHPQLLLKPLILFTSRLTGIPAEALVDNYFVKDDRSGVEDAEWALTTEGRSEIDSVNAGLKSE